MNYYCLLMMSLFLSGQHGLPERHAPGAHCQADMAPGQMDNEIVLDINALAYSIANEHDQFYSFIGVRALAMTHLAIHDVLNTLDPKYSRYAYNGGDAYGDMTAAIAESARTVLTAAYPDRTDTIDLICGKWLSTATEGKKKEKGRGLGRSVAQQIIKIREGDGHEKNGEYAPMTKPGDYQYTPGFDWVWKPDFSQAKPFTLQSLTQFRSPPPPDLKSDAYSRSFDEVKAYGSQNSKARTVDQTHIAHWWAEFGEHSWNRIGRIAARERKLPIHETARMFALINMNLYDFYLVTFDSKYHYDTWRPITAIRGADKDDNPLTKADPGWQPEMTSPPWPEYPSAHAGVGAAGAEILTHVFGTSWISFTMESVTALPEARIRTYHNLDTAAVHCAESRIYNGYHFKFATDAGLKQGRDVARYVYSHFLSRKNRSNR